MSGDQITLNDHGACATVSRPTTRMSTPMSRIPEAERKTGCEREERDRERARRAQRVEEGRSSHGRWKNSRSLRRRRFV